MAYKIKSDCISCGACEAECPVGAISAGADKYEIDPGKCIDCGACASVCPVALQKLNNQTQKIKRKVIALSALFFAEHKTRKKEPF